MRELAGEFAESLDFVNVDIDQSPETAMALEIGALPTFKVFSCGEEVGAMRGARLDAVRALLQRQVNGEQHIPSAADSTARKQARARQQENREVPFQQHNSQRSQQQAQKLALTAMLRDPSKRDRARIALATLLKLVSNAHHENVRRAWTLAAVAKAPQSPAEPRRAQV